MLIPLSTCGLLLSAALLLGACQTSQPTGSLTSTTDAAAAQKLAASLRNTRWVLRTLAGTAVTTPENAREMYLQFDATSDKVSGQAACNRFFGQFAQPSPDEVRLSNLGSTRMACDRMALETQYMQALTAATRAQITGDTLHLYAGSESKPSATFEAVYLH
ncbi:META domain-containing protein [Hymenobacter sp. GOD-10R]|uniref:META domain-containing protein n=1 Tax=Hymenobacter sp. GOD-10R TaxID=3093922 RepID=UPI002D787FA5|nr:META domain-containing protein [Hymenobacter sp. GOD-10R]WRQ26763.1 META domain-containing protein [Hymenobacter sp. GOD-10R]